MINKLSPRAFTFIETDYREVRFGEHYLEIDSIIHTHTIKVWVCSRQSQTKHTIVVQLSSAIEH